MNWTCERPDWATLTSFATRREATTCSWATTDKVVSSSAVSVDEEHFDWAPPGKRHRPLTSVARAPRHEQHQSLRPELPPAGAIASGSGDVAPAAPYPAAAIPIFPTCAPCDPTAITVTTAVKKLLNLADNYYKSGMEGFSYLPLRAHISIAIAANVYREIGVQLRLKQYGWHRGREVTSRFTKIICSIKALGSLVQRGHSYAQHNAALHQPIKGLPHVR